MRISKSSLGRNAEIDDELDIHETMTSIKILSAKFFSAVYRHWNCFSQRVRLMVK
jgi:hypothetical protein